MRKLIIIVCFMVLFTSTTVFAEDLPPDVTTGTPETENNEVIPETEGEVPVPTPQESPGGSLPVTLHFLFPESLGSSKIILTDPTGNELSENSIDSTGQGEMILPAGAEFKLSVSGLPAEPIEASEVTSIPKEEVLLWLVLSVLISGSLFFILGRWSCLKIVNQLREVLYDENLD